MRTTLKFYLAAAIITLAMSLPVAARAEQVKVNVTPGKPYLLADQKQTTYLKVSLTGLSIEEIERRTPVNIAIVIDKSGSMTGEKIRKAKEAAIMAIDRLGPNDIISVVAYDHTVEVLVPATKASEKQAIKRAVERLEVGGNTALFAGVSKGAAEVRKFLDRQRVNRIILLSDGLANVGPSSPAELGDMGASLIKEGISVTTIGLGLDYNEDLMTQIARRSDGNHAFVEKAADLVKIFNSEFGDVLSVVAQEVTMKIRCADAIRPIRVLGRDADITGQTVTAYLNQIYGNQEKYLLLEVEVPNTRESKSLDLAEVSVTYANMATRSTDKIMRSVSVRFTASERIVEENTNASVMASAVEQMAIEKNKLAVALRDQGKIEEARKVLTDNAGFLRDNAQRYKSEELERYGVANTEDAGKLDSSSWTQRRKGMYKDQDSRGRQQKY